ncbi:MAG: zinc-ribbon domain-containing protein [Anaerovorax sp.]|nr:zinc-ribbon domain-containing protein [Anaerovorax sp.]
MKSIKPGRGPSMMGGIGSIAVGIFGVFWTIGAVNMGAPWFFALFGVVFIIMAIVQAIYNFNNATNKNRFSEFDIVDESEETDPMQQYIDHKMTTESKSVNSSMKENMGIEENENKIAFCPYCGTKVSADFEFCSKCGKRLPD